MITNHFPSPFMFLDGTEELLVYTTMLVIQTILGAYQQICQPCNRYYTIQRTFLASSTAFSTMPVPPIFNLQAMTLDNNI